MKRTQMTPDVVYWDEYHNMYAVTPDCVGVYWYEDWQEIVDNYGRVPVRVVKRIEDF